MTMIKDYLQTTETDDRSLAAGLASQPLGWQSAAQLTKFSPADLRGGDGNQIFYRGLRAGWAAEAYMYSSSGRLSRLRIECRGLRSSNRRGCRRIIRFASLSATRSYRIAMLLVSAAPGAVTIGLKCADKPLATVRFLMTPNAHGVYDVTHSTTVHRENQEENGVKGSQQRSTETAFTLLNQTVEEGFGTFMPLLEHLRASLTQPPVMPTFEDLNIGAVAGCSALAIAFKEYTQNVEGAGPGAKTICGIGGLVLGIICKLIADMPTGHVPDPTSPDPFIPLVPIIVVGNDDPGNVPGDVSDGDGFSDGNGDGGGGDDGGGTEGGDGPPSGHGPLAHELTKDV
jgi:hypothetical protein